MDKRICGEVSQLIKEVKDLFELLQAIHRTIDESVDGLTDDDWLKKPAENFNNIAAIMEHITLVENKFMSILQGANEEINTQAPFKATSWDVPSIRSAWKTTLTNAKTVLESIREEDLDQPGAKLGVGELNKRQLISYTVAHTAHHRGQIPIVKKLNA